MSTVLHSTLTQNGQVTVAKETRDEIGIDQGDIVFFQIVRVVSVEGRLKYTEE